jgi:hypothetical protein
MFENKDQANVTAAHKAGFKTLMKVLGEYHTQPR